MNLVYPGLTATRSYTMLGFSHGEHQSADDAGGAARPGRPEDVGAADCGHAADGHGQAAAGHRTGPAEADRLRHANVDSGPHAVQHDPHHHQGDAGLRAQGHTARVPAHSSSLVRLYPAGGVLCAVGDSPVEIGHVDPERGQQRSGGGQLQRGAFHTQGGGNGRPGQGAGDHKRVADSPYPTASVPKPSVRQQEARPPAFQTVPLDSDLRQRKCAKLYQKAAESGLPVLGAQHAWVNRFLGSWTVVLVLGWVLLGAKVVAGESKLCQVQDVSQQYGQQFFQLKQPMGEHKVQVSPECSFPVQKCETTIQPLAPLPFLGLYSYEPCQNQTLLYCEGLPNTDFWVRTSTCQRRGFTFGLSNPTCWDVVLHLALKEGPKGWLVSDEAAVFLDAPAIGMEHWVTRTAKNQTVEISFLFEGCEPIRVQSPPLDMCVPVGEFALSLEPHAQLWTSLTWIAVYSFYLMTLAMGTWASYPNLSVLAQALLMASHVPLYVDLGFTWYLLTSCVACLIPLLWFSLKGLVSLCRHKQYFRLPSPHTTNGLGHLLMVVSLQLATTVAVISLGQDE